MIANEKQGLRRIKGLGAAYWQNGVTSADWAIGAIFERAHR